MNIAITFENNEVFQHFGKSKTFIIYKVEDKNITDKNIINVESNGHGVLADFLKNNDVKVVICGGIGEGAITSLSNAGIELIGGAAGNVDEVIKAYIEGTLKHNPLPKCNHHH